MMRALLVLCLLAAATPAAAGVLGPLRARLLRARGARVEVLQVTSPAPGLPADSARLRVVLVAPGYLRLDRTDGRLQLALRPDGGEALDHDLRQLTTMRPDQTADAAGVWGLLMGKGEMPPERPAGPRTTLLLLGDASAALPESLWITLGADSLPTRISTGGTPAVHMELSRWRFVRTPPRSTFRLEAPPGFVRVEWP